MFLDIVISLVGIILLMFGIQTSRHHRCSTIVPNNHYKGGAASPKVKETEAEARIAKQKDGKKIGKEYERLVTVDPYSDEWATGILMPKYPVCPYVTPKGHAMPRGIKYTGINNLGWERHPRHWGQRKLLLTEIDFLTQCLSRGTESANSPCIVVYAGAADGRHMPLITEMFPNVELHLYDPRPFYKGLDGAPRIRLNPFYGGAGAARVARPDDSKYGWFTDEVAEWYAQCDNRVILAPTADAEPTDLSSGKRIAPKKCRTVYFVSDIRTAPTEAEIESNQRQQEGWVQKMRPAAAMLKFKLPYPEYKAGDPASGGSADYQYLAGDIHFQCWAPTASAESRLVVCAPKSRNARFATRRYDTVAYERNFAWYNTILREHDFSDRLLRDFIPLDKSQTMTIKEFWTGAGLGDPILKIPNRDEKSFHLGWDFVYELKILAAAMVAREEKITKITKITAESLRAHVIRINEVLVSPGAHFSDYLKTYRD